MWRTPWSARRSRYLTLVSGFEYGRPVAEVREFKDIRGGARDEEALSVEEFMADLEALQPEMATTRNRVWERVADGTLSVELVKRFCKEYYFLGKWYTAEFGSLVSNAPDTDALDARPERAPHPLVPEPRGRDRFRRRSQPRRHEGRVGPLHGDHRRGALTYRPMPETIGLVFTSCYYMRRSYEEGLAAFGWAGERFAASTGYAKMMYEGLRDHYGIDVENFKVHAYAEADHGDAADYLLRKVAMTAAQHGASGAPSSTRSSSATPGPSP